jgi:hypothetical protein
MRFRLTRVTLLAGLLLVGACTTIPTGPSVLVLPGTGKNFDQFRFDDQECRHYAGSQLGTTADEAQIDSGLKSAAIGTAVGAVAGAIAGGHRGAATGAGVGLIGGSVAGAGAAGASGYGAQRRYDNSYQQCMYAKGHRIPVAGRYDRPAQQLTAPAVPPAPAAPGYTTPPPPPPGTPPPPPRS